MEQQHSPKSALLVQEKQKQFYVFRKVLKYLCLSDQFNLTLVNKEVNKLGAVVRKYYLCQNDLHNGLTKRRKMLWIL